MHALNEGCGNVDVRTTRVSSRKAVLATRSPLTVILSCRQNEECSLATAFQQPRAPEADVWVRLLQLKRVESDTIILKSTFHSILVPKSSRGQSW